MKKSPGFETCSARPAMSQLRAKTADMSASRADGDVYQVLGGVSARSMGPRAEGQEATVEWARQGDDKRERAA